MPAYHVPTCGGAKSFAATRVEDGAECGYCDAVGALNVDNLDDAIAFYAQLFTTEPAKRKPGCADFAIAEPPLKLVSLVSPGKGGILHHLGSRSARPAALALKTRSGRPGQADSSGRCARCRPTRKHSALAARHSARQALPAHLDY